MTDTTQVRGFQTIVEMTEEGIGAFRTAVQDILAEAGATDLNTRIGKAENFLLMLMGRAAYGVFTTNEDLANRLSDTNGWDAIPAEKMPDDIEFAADDLLAEQGFVKGTPAIFEREGYVPPTVDAEDGDEFEADEDDTFADWGDEDEDDDYLDFDDDEDFDDDWDDEDEDL